MKHSKKIITMILSVCLIVLNTFVVKATSGDVIKIVFDEGYDPSQGSLKIKVDDGDWNTFTESSEHFITLTNETVLKFKLVAEEGYEVDFTAGPHLSGGFDGVAFEAGGEDVAAKRDLLIGDGYEVAVGDPSVDVSFTQIAFKETTVKRTSTMSISIESEEGSNLEYWIADIPSRVTFMLPGTEDIKFGQNNLTWKGGIEPSAGVYAKGVSTTQDIEVEYDYDNSGNVSFLYHISNSNTKIISLKINNEDYTENCPSTDEEILGNIADGGRNTKDIDFNIPYAEHYDVEIVAAFHDLMGGFGWNYLPEESQSGDTREDCIAHGRLEFVSGQYGEAVYNSVSEWNNATVSGSHVFSWKDGNKDYEDERDAWGEASFPKGAIITMKLVPDEGYQLFHLYGDENIEPQDATGVYKITMKGGMNSHLMATFEEVDDKVNATASNISNGTISNVENTNGIGTMRLDVADIESQDSKDNLDDYAAKNDSEVLDYLSIDLFNTVYKANEDGSDTWDEQISELDNPAIITLHIDEDYSDKENLYVIHNHEGEIVEIPATYDDQNNTITFETDKFSDYGIAATAQNTITTTTDGNGSAEPESVVVEEGESKLISITPNEGYVFDHVDATGIEEGEEGTTYSILYSGWPTVVLLVNEMPDNNVEFDVHFAEAVKVEIDSNGGIEGPDFKSERIIKKGQTEEAPFEIWDDFLSPPEGKELDYVEINGEQFDPSSEYTFDENITVKYIWKDAPKEKEYHVKNDKKGAEMIFMDEDGNEYILMVFDLLNLSDEDYEILDIDKKTADEIIKNAKNKLKDYNDVLSIYLAQLVNLNDDHYPSGPIKLRIKADSKVNGYDNLRIIDSKNLFDDETFDPEIIRSIKVVNGYIEIMMPDLGYNFWTLSGTKKENIPVLPKTGIQ